MRWIRERVDDPNLVSRYEEADPAQDPEVQARVLRAYFETFGNVAATPFQKEQRALLVEYIRNGSVVLHVEEVEE